MTELEILIEEQKRDMEKGHMVSRPHTTTLIEEVDHTKLKPRRSRFNKPLSEHDPRHGTTAGYWAGCKCSRCLKAYSIYRGQRRRHNAQLPTRSIPHGLNGYNNYMCRCPICKAANAKSQRERRAPKTSND